jgi:hypothetical protein
MDRERWRHIEELYESVVESSPTGRAALLAQADTDIPLLLDRRRSET